MKNPTQLLEEIRRLEAELDAKRDQLRRLQMADYEESIR